MSRHYLAAAAMIAAATITSALASPPGPAPDPALAQAGRKHFIRCIACHAVRADARPMTGPHLEGIVGRPAAGLPGFAYTDTMRAQDFVWDEARLDAFLESPHELNPGMCLTFAGLPRAEDRAALIAYLKSLAP